MMVINNKFFAFCDSQQCRIINKDGIVRYEKFIVDFNRSRK